MATPALRAWLEAAFDGNLGADEWTMEALRDGPAMFTGSVLLSGAWHDTRDRAISPLPEAPIAQQQAEALQRGSPIEDLCQAVLSDPSLWLYSAAARPFAGWCFAHTAIEACDTCHEAGAVKCSPCGGDGRSRCSACHGSGRDDRPCGGCGGSGRSGRTRQVRFVNGSIVDTRIETYYVTCLACGGGGRAISNCRRCGTTGTVTCSECSGRGRVSCRDCAGVGRRNYRYDRRFLVDVSATLDLDGAIPEEIEQQVLLRRWQTLVKGGDAQLSDVTMTSGVDGGVTFDFRAAPPMAVARVSSRGSSGRAWCFGSTAAICDAEPILARALDLDRDHDKLGWSKRARELAGRRLLTEASQTFAAEGGASEARRAAVAKAAHDRYGPLLGSAGADAIASTVSLGIGKLRGDALREVWRLNIAGSSIAGLLVAIAIVALVSNAGGREPQYEVFRTPTLIVRDVLFAVLAWVAMGCVLAWHRIKAIGRMLGLPTAPAQGGSKAFLAWPLASAAAYIVLAIGIPYGAYSIAVPAIFRKAADRALIPPVLPVVAAIGSVNLRALPSERAVTMRLLKPGMQLRVLEDDNGRGWTKVRWNMGYGFVATRYLRRVPPEQIDVP